MKGFIVDETYRIEHDKAYVYLFGRLENGASFCSISHFRPYFCIRKEDAAAAKKLPSTIPFEVDDSDFRTMQEQPVVKVITSIPRDVPVLRKLFEESKIPCFEADVRFTHRFLMDHEILRSLDISGSYEESDFVDRLYKEPTLTPSDWYPDLHILSFDIECSQQFDIYSISIVSEHKGERTEEALIVSDRQDLDRAKAFPDERSLLDHFRARIIALDPDIVTGWNSIDFDLNVLRERFKMHNVPFRMARQDWDCTLRIENSFLKDSAASFPGRQVLDGIHMLKLNFIQLDNYKLGTAAHELLGEEKLIGDANKVGEIDDAYRNDQQKLIDYNLKDSHLVLDILKATNALDIMVNRASLTGMSLDRVRGSIASFDSLYLRELRKRGYVAPSARFSESEERISGGYVKSSTPGIFDYVVVWDFKSLYPSIMRTFNIDPLAFERGKDAKDPSNKHKWITSPNDVVFSAEEGILPELLQRLWDARDIAKKKKDARASFAIKILMNSFFGVLASPACRFYSLDMANAITAYARHFIRMTIKEVEKRGYEVIYGDSVTAERPIVVRKNGRVEILSIEKLFRRYASSLTNDGDKERIDVRKFNFETLSIDGRRQPCFARVDEIVRHRAEKRVFRVSQKFGETRCTEDHSLILQNGLEEVRPQNIGSRELARVSALPEVERIDEIDLWELLKGYVATSTYKGRWKFSEMRKDDTHVSFGWTERSKPVRLRRKISFPSPEGDALSRLLGAYIAEGSSSTPETTSTRWGATIANGDRLMLEQLKTDYGLLFENVDCGIISTGGDRFLEYDTLSGTKTVQYQDTTLRLSMMNQLSAVLFKQLCGQKSAGKHLPSFIFHLPEREQRILLSAMVDGDGSRVFAKGYSDEYCQKNFRYTTSSLLLVSGVSLLLKQLGYTFSLRHDLRKKAYTISTSSRNNTNLTTKVIQESYDGYVYDLSVDGTHMFADACGQILLHNTDSVFVNLNVESIEEAEKISERTTKEINAFYRKHIEEEYKRTSYMELESEKVFVRFIMPRVRGSEEGAKKRYAGLVITDGKEEVKITGLEFVRRDWTELAKEFQMTILTKVFKKESPEEYIRTFVQDLKDGKHDDLLVYQKAVRKELASYTKTTPPHVKAARLLEERGKKITSNIIEYLMTSDGPWPLGLEGMPAIDYDHYVEKQLAPIADAILGFYDTSFNDVIKGSKQMTLGGF